MNHIPNPHRARRGNQSVSDDYPHIRKVGRYVFFALCAFSMSILVYAIFRKLGAADFVCDHGANIVMFVCFLALRDMDKNARLKGPPA